MPLISIASVTLPNFQGNSDSIALFIYTNAAFTAQSGTSHQATNPSGLPYGGRQSLGTFFQSIACTVSGNNLTIPAISLDSTTDSLDNAAGASYSAVLWDTTAGQPIQPFGTFARFILPETPTSTTWAAIFATEATS